MLWIGVGVHDGLPEVESDVSVRYYWLLIVSFFLFCERFVAAYWVIVYCTQCVPSFQQSYRCFDWAEEMLGSDAAKCSWVKVLTTRFVKAESDSHVCRLCCGFLKGHNESIFCHEGKVTWDKGYGEACPRVENDSPGRRVPLAYSAHLEPVWDPRMIASMMQAVAKEGQLFCVFFL